MRSCSWYELIIIKKTSLALIHGQFYPETGEKLNNNNNDNNNNNKVFNTRTGKRLSICINSVSFGEKDSSFPLVLFVTESKLQTIFNVANIFRSMTKIN